MSIKSFLLRYRFLSVGIVGLFLLIRLILINFPLVDNLDIEVSIIFSFLTSISSGFVVIFLLKRNERIRYHFVIFLATLFVVFLISLVYDLLIEGCCITVGVLFYPIFTISSLIFGTSAGIVFYYIIKKFKYVCLTLFYLLLIFMSLLEYYYKPQLFLFNPLVIYFPGLVYDEFVDFSLTILKYSLIIILLSLPSIIFQLIKERKHYQN